MTATVYLAVFEDGENKYLIEYQPAEDGAVMVVSVDVQARLEAPFKRTRHKRRRGIELSEHEQAASDLYPYAQREAKIGA